MSDSKYDEKQTYAVSIKLEFDHLPSVVEINKKLQELIEQNNVPGELMLGYDRRVI